MGDPSLDTYAPNAPITGERKLNLDLQSQLPNPYLARALVAVDPDHPNGTEGKKHRNMSILQQHVAFFDKNNDGIVYPWDTYRGFRAIGFGVIITGLAAIISNLLFSYRTLPFVVSKKPGRIPSLLLPIYIRNIHKYKHGSDSETCDTEGRFDPPKFGALFSKYALTDPDALTLDEIFTMLKANRRFGDFIGWITTFGEWMLLYVAGKDEHGLLQRETIRGLFDGSLFEQLEKKMASRSKRE